MTDHNREEREALIEEVAKAIYEAGVKRDFGFADWWEIEQAELEARAALAVFEQAEAKPKQNDANDFAKGDERANVSDPEKSDIPGGPEPLEGT